LTPDSPSRSSIRQLLELASTPPSESSRAPAGLPLAAKDVFGAPLPRTEAEAVAQIAALEAALDALNAQDADSSGASASGSHYESCRGTITDEPEAVRAPPDVHAHPWQFQPAFLRRIEKAADAEVAEDASQSGSDADARVRPIRIPSASYEGQRRERSVSRSSEVSIDRQIASVASEAAADWTMTAEDSDLHLDPPQLRVATQPLPSRADRQQSATHISARFSPAQTAPSSPSHTATVRRTGRATNAHNVHDDQATGFNGAVRNGMPAISPRDDIVNGFRTRPHSRSPFGRGADVPPSQRGPGWVSPGCVPGSYSVSGARQLAAKARRASAGPLTRTAAGRGRTEGHNVHADQDVPYLGAAQQPGSAAQSPYSDLCKGHRHVEGCAANGDIGRGWVGPGRHRGSFSVVAAEQAVVGMTRKLALSRPASPAGRGGQAELRLPPSAYTARPLTASPGGSYSASALRHVTSSRGRSVAQQSAARRLSTDAQTRRGLTRSPEPVQTVLRVPSAASALPRSESVTSRPATPQRSSSTGPARARAADSARPQPLADLTTRTTPTKQARSRAGLH